MRYRMDISYKGTRYHGWQSQHNATGVQDVLEEKMQLLLRSNVRVTASGRTDTGVHALQQTVHFDIDGALPPDFIYHLNNVLPYDISVLDCVTVADSFHARFDALERSYIYKIAQRKQPFLHEQVYFFYPPLDIEAMNTAASFLLGTHDFTSFSRVKTDVSHFRCNVTSAYWEKKEPFLFFNVSANRFLRGMVRALVGTMLWVGTGKIQPEHMLEIMGSEDRRNAGPAAPPEGLYLKKILYPET